MTDLGRALQLLTVFAAIGPLVLGGCRAHAQVQPTTANGGASDFTVDADIALNALMSLGDGHLEKMAGLMTVLSGTEAARSADWERIRRPLAEAAVLAPAAVNWFALPDGTYWTVEAGRAAASLADRPYFPRLLAGETVIGDLVVSRATGRSTAIVAVPVRGSGGEIVGAFGASVHLDSLSQHIQREMGLGAEHVFYTLDAEPMVGLHADPETIFLHPLEEGDPDLERAIREMLEHGQGAISYAFRGRERTVLYRRSPVTGWLYAFGMLQP
jgi:hypothetical protein